MFTRRTLLLMLGTSLTVSRGKLFQSTRTDFKVVLRTRLPREMSEQEFLRQAENWQNSPALDALTAAHRREGRILHDHFRIHENHSEWFITFRDVESFELWSRLSEPLFNQPKMRAQGFYFLGSIPLNANPFLA